MTTQQLTRSPITEAPASRPSLPHTSWRSLGHDFAYVVPGFFLTVVGFVVLWPLLTLGVGTLVLWVGAPVLGLMLLAASGFARENRELLRSWGVTVPEPRYLRPAPGVARRLIATIADPQTWKEAIHALLVALPLRTTTFVLSVTWVATALGGLTWWVWGRFLPPGDHAGLTWLVETVTGATLGGDRYLTESLLYLAAGAVLLVLAPWVVRSCARVDAMVARALLGGEER